MNLFIACSSSNDISDYYIKDCNVYLNELFKNDYNLVFGAYNAGLMGEAYNIALKNNRNILGICPEVFKDDLDTLNCTNKIITDDILDRTKSLINNSDVLIFLPGGIGTFLELMAAIDMKRNGEINKPIIIYNCNNYFDQLFDFLEVMYTEKFSSFELKNIYHISNNISDTLDYINNYFN